MLINILKHIVISQENYSRLKPLDNAEDSVSYVVCMLPKDLEQLK